MSDLSMPPLFPEPSLKERSGLMAFAWISLGAIAALATIWFLLVVALKYSPSSTISAQPEQPTQIRVFGDYKPKPRQQDWPEFDNLFTVSAANLQQQIEKAAKQYEDVTVAVSVRAITDAEHIAYQEDHSFTAASTTKLITAAAALSMVDNKTIKLSDKLGDSTVEKQLQLLVNQSNNTAWDHLNNLVGLQNLQDFGSDLGLHSFRVNGNKINAHDLAVFLQMLYRYEILSDTSTEMLLSWMQKTNQPLMLPAVFNESHQSIYHKYGWIYASVHDAAIVIHRDQPLIIVVMTDGSTNYNQGQKIVREMAALVKENLN